MSGRLEGIEKMLINTDKLPRVGNRKEIDFRHCAFDTLKEAKQLESKNEHLLEVIESALYDLQSHSFGWAKDTLQRALRGDTQ